MIVPAVVAIVVLWLLGILIFVGLGHMAARGDRCAHDWRYDEAESAGPWTGYIERCARCGALQQIPQ